MLGIVTPNLAELARHIVAISDFWRRSESTVGNDGGARAIRAMIETWIGSGDSEKICGLVVRELEVLKHVSLGDHETGLAFKAECVFTLLAGEFGRPELGTPTAAQLTFESVELNGNDRSAASA